MAAPDRSKPGAKRLRWVVGSVVVGVIAVALKSQMGRPAEQIAAQSRENDPALGRGRPETPPSPEALHDGFELQDADARSLARVMVIGVVAIALSIGGLFVLLAFFHAQDERLPPLTPQQSAVVTPPGPPLQSRPLEDIAALRSREDGKLIAYRWRSPDHTTAQIPIERAMALTVGKPLDPTP